MARLRSPWTRAFLVLTVVMVLVAVVLFAAAVIGFLRSADDCWFQTGPCAQAGDANDMTLRIAVFGVPLVWLVGVFVGVAAHAWARRGRAASR
jgi:ABC-type Fe3+ transport system permease subunit